MMDYTQWDKQLIHLFQGLRKLSRRMSKLMREYPEDDFLQMLFSLQSKTKKIDEADRMLGEPGLQDLYNRLGMLLPGVIETKEHQDEVTERLNKLLESIDKLMLEGPLEPEELKEVVDEIISKTEDLYQVHDP